MYFLPGYRQKVNDIVQGALFPEAGLDNRVGHAGGAGGLVIVCSCHVFFVLVLVSCVLCLSEFV